MISRNIVTISCRSTNALFNIMYEVEQDSIEHNKFIELFISGERFKLMEGSEIRFLVTSMHKNGKVIMEDSDWTSPPRVEEREEVVKYLLDIASVPPSNYRGYDGRQSLQLAALEIEKGKHHEREV